MAQSEKFTIWETNTLFFNKEERKFDHCLLWKDVFGYEYFSGFGMEYPFNIDTDDEEVLDEEENAYNGKEKEGHDWVLINRHCIDIVEPQTYFWVTTDNVGDLRLDIILGRTTEYKDLGEEVLDETNQFEKAREKAGEILKMLNQSIPEEDFLGEEDLRRWILETQNDWLEITEIPKIQ